MKLCTKCILPETFPGITFDDSGVCSHCRSWEKEDSCSRKQVEQEQKFLDLVQAHRGKNDYDLLMAYSGGKDSTYTLSVFKEKYGLSILALTFDNGFISPAATANIRNTVEHLGIDHITVKPRFDLLRKIFVAVSTENIFSPKAIERASTICTACMGLVKSLALKLALEKRIPFIGYGWSPGQASIESAAMKMNPSFIISTQKQFYNALFKIAGRDISPYFPREEDVKNAALLPYNIHPLVFLDYNEHAIFRKVRTLGWIDPKDTDANSTNCLLNGLANKIHKQSYAFHPYVYEIAGMVRTGAMTRDEGIKKIEQAEDETIISQVKKKLGITAPA